MANTMKINANEIVNILSNAKRGGQFVSIEGESDIRLNKFPTDGSERVRIADGFQPKAHFVVEYHFAQDYDRAMSKLLGEDYVAHDDNRRHIIHNVMMEYISTHNVCLIYMATSRKSLGTTINGQPISEEQIAYMKHYLAPHKDNPLSYRTLSLKNVKAITMGGIRYEIVSPKVGEIEVA